ncbi:MAG: IS4 family transposase [Ketobacter sp.]|nr:IS4 family transposase [Ketobacter sp.]
MSLKELLYSQSFKERSRVHHSHFTRDRKLTLPQLILFMTDFIKGSLQAELNQHFKEIHQLVIPTRFVTKSAYCQARMKVKPEAFVELNEHTIQFLEEHRTLKVWKGLRILAVDGTTVRVPDEEEILDYFGGAKRKTGGVKALGRVSTVFDVLNKITFEAHLAPYATSEGVLAVKHLANPLLPTNSLFLMDRGYGDFQLLQRLRRDGHHFCVRVKKDLIVVKELEASGLRDTLCMYQPCKETIAKCIANQVSVEPIQVRLLAIPLSSGETEYLMTSLLDCQTYPYQEFNHLYHQRWETEENYKTKKCRLVWESFTGKSVRSVFQDFHAKVFSENLTQILTSLVEPEIESINQERFHDYKVNFTAALSLMKNSMSLLFLREDVQDLLSQLFDEYIRGLNPVRPGRKYPRKHQGKNQPKLQHFRRTYAPTR